MCRILTSSISIWLLITAAAHAAEFEVRVVLNAETRPIAIAPRGLARQVLQAVRNPGSAAQRANQSYGRLSFGRHATRQPASFLSALLGSDESRRSVLAREAAQGRWSAGQFSVPRAG